MRLPRRAAIMVASAVLVLVLGIGVGGNALASGADLPTLLRDSVPGAAYGAGPGVEGAASLPGFEPCADRAALAPTETEGVTPGGLTPCFLSDR